MLNGHTWQMAAPEPAISDLFGYRTSIAEWASILALLVSGYAAIMIRKVRRDIVNRARLPDFISEIKKTATDLAELGRNYDANRDAIIVVMEVSDTNLKVLQTRIGSGAKDTIRSLRRSISNYRGRGWRSFFRQQHDARQDMWNIYASLNGLIEELKHAQADYAVGG